VTETSLNYKRRVVIMALKVFIISYGLLLKRKLKKCSFQKTCWSEGTFFWHFSDGFCSN